MSWFDQSIMKRKALANGDSNNTYDISEEFQKEYYYVYGGYVDPILNVEPGSTINVETHDAFEGKIKKETDIPSKILNFKSSKWTYFYKWSKKRRYSCSFNKEYFSKGTRTIRNNSHNARVWRSCSYF